MGARNVDTGRWVGLMNTNTKTMSSKLDKLRDVLACPECHGDLDFSDSRVVCSGCSREFAVAKGKFYFARTPAPTDPMDSIKEKLKRLFGKYYYSIGTKLLAPDYPVNYLKIIREYIDPADNVVIDAGCGNLRIHESVIGLDLNDYDAVDVVCDLQSLPFKGASVDAVVSKSLLEHVSDPFKVTRHFDVITKPGGLGIHITPFMYPFHASPNDFFRFSHMGIAALFPGWEILSQIPVAGPFTLMLTCLYELISSAVSFGNEQVKGIIYLLMCIVFFPFKFLDFFFVNRRQFMTMAPIILTVLRKPENG